MQLLLTHFNIMTVFSVKLLYVSKKLSCTTSLLSWLSSLMRACVSVFGIWPTKNTIFTVKFNWLDSLVIGGVICVNEKKKSKKIYNFDNNKISLKSNQYIHSWNYCLCSTDNCYN